jgi:hypothetical protein
MASYGEQGNDLTLKMGAIHSSETLVTTTRCHNPEDHDGHSYEPSDSIKEGEFLGYLSDCQLLKKDYTSCS